MHREWLEISGHSGPGDCHTRSHRAGHIAPHRACRPVTIWADAPDKNSARQTSIKSTAGCSSCCHGLLFWPLSM